MRCHSGETEARLRVLHPVGDWGGWKGPRRKGYGESELGVVSGAEERAVRGVRGAQDEGAGDPRAGCVSSEPPGAHQADGGNDTDEETCQNAYEMIPGRG